MFKKLTKTQVKALVKKEGKLDIALVPSNVYPDYKNPWVKPYDITLEKDDYGNANYTRFGQTMDFDSVINNFKYYNCCSELGNRVHFYKIEK